MELHNVSQQAIALIAAFGAGTIAGAVARLYNKEPGKLPGFTPRLTCDATLEEAKHEDFKLMELRKGLVRHHQQMGQGYLCVRTALEAELGRKLDAEEKRLLTTVLQAGDKRKKEQKGQKDEKEEHGEHQQTPSAFTHRAISKARQMEQGRAVAADPNVGAGTGAADTDISDIAGAMAELRELHGTARYVPAGALADGIDAAIANATVEGGSGISPALREEWEALAPVAAESRARRAKVEETKAVGFDGTEGWILSKDTKRSKTYYRLDDETGRLWLKVDGIVDASMIDCLAIWKEADLYKTWFPLMSESSVEHKFSDTELVVRYFCGLWGVGREILVHAWGDCSSLEEDKSFIIVAESPKEDEGGKGAAPAAVKGVPMPGVAGWRTRAEMTLQLLVQHKGVDPATGVDRVRNCMIVCLDLKTALPDALLQSVMKKCIGMMVSAMNHQARKIAADPGCKHTAQMRADPWYGGWLFPFLVEKSVIPGLKYPGWWKRERQGPEETQEGTEPTELAVTGDAGR